MQLSCSLDQMLTFKPLQTDSLEQQNKFFETFSENYIAIQAVNVNDLENFILFHIAFRCLDSTTKKSFDTDTDNTVLPSFRILIDFFDKQVRAAALSQTSSSALNKILTANIPASSKASWSTSPAKRSILFTSSVKRTPLCLHCKGHEQSLYKCPDCRALPLRCEFVNASKLYGNYLKDGHVLPACPAFCVVIVTIPYYI